MTTWQEYLKEDRKIIRELHLKHVEKRFDYAEIGFLINEFDRASEDKTKLEIAGRLISLVQKMML